MKGLLAPQNTFLDTIATRFDGTRESGLGQRASAPGDGGQGVARGALCVPREPPLPSPPPSGGFLGIGSRQRGGGGEGAPSLSRSPVRLLRSFAGEEGAGSPLLPTPCSGAAGGPGRGRAEPSRAGARISAGKLCAGLGLPLPPRAPGSREPARQGQASEPGQGFGWRLREAFFLYYPQSRYQISLKAEFL